MSVYKIYYIISMYYISKKYQIFRLLRLSGHIAKKLFCKYMKISM